MVTEGPPKRWSRFRTVAALVFVGLYLTALTRLVVSRDWGDLTATRLFGLADVVAALLALVTIGLTTVATDGPRKRWTKRRTVVVLVVSGLFLVGIIRSIISTGTVWADPMGQLFMQTAGFAFMLFLIIGWIPLEHRRR
ncbi:hypothetical protein [Nocardia sp. NPDC051570]|uniref:hypothetical protein n=1 Tax=Nocardia sp. NPDC051570 TaxID=3364324 RepID=UPI0037BC3EE3